LPRIPRSIARPTRPPRRRCANKDCRLPIPPEHLRDDLSSKTDICTRCARIRLAIAYQTAEARAWLAGWVARMQDALKKGRG
jgi:hypothetical protein